MRTRGRELQGWAPAASFAVLLLCSLCCYCEGLCHDMDRRALLELKHSINYPNGSSLPGWSGHAGVEECCRWPGVTCDDSTGRVVGIELPKERTIEKQTWYPNLTMLVHLSEVERLDLSGNNMGGWAFAKALCELKHLRELNLSFNSLQGVPPPKFSHCLCQLRSLARLSLANNQIRGRLLPCLCNVSSLTRLDISSNLLQGSIPPCLGNLYSVEQMDLVDNEFVGSIPPTIFHNLTNLKRVSIGSNQLEGTLELSVFANLSNLVYLYISSNNGLEIETESPSWVPSFQLNVLRIHGCPLNKRSRHQLPSFLATQHLLFALNLYGCSLEGRLPPWLFCNSSLSRLFLGNNLFRDMFPQPCHNSSSNIRYLAIRDNRIYGSLPNSVGFLFPRLEFLSLSGNKVEGQLPPSLGRIPLQFLDLSENNLSGKLPPELTRNASMLKWVNLSKNKLQGEMLPRCSHMPRLQFLYLGRNSFSGSISPAISNSSDLLLLDVGENNLRCNLSSCLPVLGGGVSGLLLRENNFKGHLPMHLCQLPNLQFLDVSANKLSGEIPPCLNNISMWKLSTHHGLSQSRLAGRSEGNSSFTIIVSTEVEFTSKHNLRKYTGGPLPLMTGLDLSSNRLDGNIPPELGELNELQTLNLSNNHLRGPIPALFDNLRSIESLDLSHNGLNGTIPHELVRLHFLEIFSVAFNNLSGPIPSGGQFSSFNASSYEGNAGLCGPPLEQGCSSNSTKQPDKEEQRWDGGGYGSVLDNDALFYTFLACSYVLGLWCFMAIFLLKSGWRIKYFRAIDRFYDRYVSWF